MEEESTLLSEILSRLMFEHRIKATELARKIDVPQPTIHRIATGKSPNPHKQSLEAIAKYFSITVSQLRGEAPLPSSLMANKKIAINQLSTIPIVPWNTLLTTPADQLCQHPTENTLVVAPNVNPKAFAVEAADDAMLPNFNRQTLLIFDPEKPFKDRSYVLARCGNDDFLFRQLLVDDEYHYLNPLNPDKEVFRMHILEKSDKIIATLIEARRQYDDL